MHDISYVENGHVGVLTSNRPDVHNALRHQSYAELTELVRTTLVVIATGDDFVGNVDMRRRAAARAGATVVELPLQHWWMLENPSLAAEILTNFWNSLSTVDAPA